MDIMEIILLIAGGVVFILSFFIPDRKTADAVSVKELTEEERQKFIQEELLAIKVQIDDLAERTERSLEKISNEKIMAVDEYSTTVLEEIHKNHEEAMFLYDMLNNKHTSLRNTLSEVARTAKEAEKAISSMQDITFSKAEDESGKERADFSKEQEPENVISGRNAGASDIQQNLEEPFSAAEADAAGRSNNERILALYRQGKNAVAIAKELGLGTGEVKLVIDLFRNT